MTCIVGLKTEVGVWIGADSCQSSGTMIIPEGALKVFAVEEFLFAFAGMSRGGDLTQHAFTPPVRSKGETLEHYVHVSFVNTLRELHKQSGFSEKENEKEKQENNAIFAYRGRLFGLYSDYSVVEYNDYIADGSGVGYALGSLYSTEGLPTPDRVKEAIAAACKFNAYVSEPINILFQVNPNKPSYPKCK